MTQMMFIILTACLVCGCNVFYDVESARPDSGSDNSSNSANSTNSGNTLECVEECRCTSNCEIVCADNCKVECGSDATCTGTVGDGSTIQCDESTCNVDCTDGECTYECESRESTCRPNCPAGVACILRCGNDRLPPQQDQCEFDECGSELTDCGDGVFACGTRCPGPPR